MRVLDKKGGSQLWARSFDKKITGIGGAMLVVSFIDNQSDSLNYETGKSNSISR